MSYTWPDSSGKRVDINLIDDITLLADTQRLVDAHRRFLDDCMRQLAEQEEYYLVMYKEDADKIRTMTFTGRLKAMVDECVYRGLGLDISR